MEHGYFAVSTLQLSFHCEYVKYIKVYTFTNQPLPRHYELGSDSSKWTYHDRDCTSNGTNEHKYHITTKNGEEKGERIKNRVSTLLEKLGISWFSRIPLVLYRNAVWSISGASFMYITHGCSLAWVHVCTKRCLDERRNTKTTNFGNIIAFI